MRKVKVITGSQASLSTELAKEFAITIIPYSLNYPDTSLKEGVDISTEDFYKTLRKIDSLPSSSPPAIGEIINCIDAVNKDNTDIILITLSSRYSQMYNSCKSAVSEGGYKNVHLIDSQGASAYQAMMVIIVAQMALAGKSLDSILDCIKDFNNRSDEFLVFDTLKYLAKGGRIGKVKALLGSMISIKPIVVHRDGITTPLAKARTNKQALNKIISEIKSKVIDRNMKIAVIIQGIDVEGWLIEVEKQLREHFNIENLWHSRFSAVTSIHTGPKVWSITYHIL